MAAAVLLAAIATGAEGLEWLGEGVLPRDPVGVAGPVGGLSGLSYDAERDVFFAVSDDGGRFGPARIYELNLRLDPGRRGKVSARVTEALGLSAQGGATYTGETVDPESLARTPAGKWIISSEGNAKAGVPAALIEFGDDGRWHGEIEIPRRYRPRKRKGIRHNAALESVSISPDGRWLFSATESALLQDGPEATVSAGSPCRLLRFDLSTRRLRSTYLYRTEPIAVPPLGDAFAVSGLVDLLALDESRLLALERSYTAGEGNSVKLFLVDLSEASDVSRVRRLGRARGLLPASKRQLLDVAALGATPDNLEGMAFGPRLADGRLSLFLIADDNFNPESQSNQVLAFALDPAELERPAPATGEKKD
jgi:3-phytase/alkaline phosphatase D